MTSDRLISLALKAYIWLVLLIVFAPILTSFVFSFDANKFAAIPWGGFSTKWYAEAFADPDVAKGLRNTVIVALSSSILATLIGFTAAYTDY
ncbi:MAG TPA: ABC transporter permease, partial [Nordella sp.]|nr:ABC transporter permease [Nordella sp.]